MLLRQRISAHARRNTITLAAACHLRSSVLKPSSPCHSLMPSSLRSPYSSCLYATMTASSASEMGLTPCRQGWFVPGSRQ